jgi:hypothetical protein
MTYKTQYAEINAVGAQEAWEVAMGLDGSLRNRSPEDVESLKEALVTLARRVLELEREWS